MYVADSIFMVIDGMMCGEIEKSKNLLAGFCQNIESRVLRYLERKGWFPTMLLHRFHCQRWKRGLFVLT